MLKSNIIIYYISRTRSTKKTERKTEGQNRQNISKYTDNEYPPRIDPGCLLMSARVGLGRSVRFHHRRTLHGARPASRHHLLVSSSFSQLARNQPSESRVHVHTNQRLSSIISLYLFFTLAIIIHCACQPRPASFEDTLVCVWLPRIVTGAFLRRV